MKFYQSWLVSELDRRKEKNENYSLRSFARSLNVSPSLISRISNGSLKPSIKTVSTIIVNSNLNEEEREEFITSILEENREEINRLISNGAD